jgi:hypothetical protein
MNSLENDAIRAAVREHYGTVATGNNTGSATEGEEKKGAVPPPVAAAPPPPR